MPSFGIHSSAIVSAKAKIEDDVVIGPYCIIGPNVEIGRGTKLNSHVVIEGHTKIGSNNQFYPFCSIGAPPQDIGYRGEDTKVTIGENNVFRESVTVHRGTTKENWVTTIGNQNYFMAYSHVGHDDIIGNNCIIVNSVNLAGHVHIGNNVIIGGGSNVSQFITLGRGAYVGGATAINKDIPAYCTAYGNRVKLKGINIIGMRRQGHSKQDITEVVDFYRSMESSALSARSFIDQDELMEEYTNNLVVNEIVECIRNSKVGIAPFMD